MRIFVSLFMLITISSTVSAQDRHGLKLPAVLLATAGAIDISSTLHNSTQQARYTPGSGVEQNPLIAWMEPRMGTAGMLTVASTVELGAFWLACRRWCETHPKLMKWGLLTGAAAHGMAAAGNILSARDAAAWRRQQGQ